MASRRPVTAEARVRSRVSPCGVCDGQSGTGTGFSSSTSVFAFQFHSTGAPLARKRKKLIVSLKAAVRPSAQHRGSDGRPGSVTGHSVWNLWWAVWNCDVFHNTSVFLVGVTPPYSILSYTKLWIDSVSK
jgi:hypothetical protein